MLADMARPRRIEPGPGQESVWDYPRPPRVDPTDSHVVVEFAGRVIADTRRPVRVLETSQAPGIYIPAEDVDRACWCRRLGRGPSASGRVRRPYWSVQVGDRVAVDAAWSYPEPTARLRAASPATCPSTRSTWTAAWVDDEQVEANEGDFYGGWVTSKVVGPFKGGAGTWGW